jgi:hypothetical protein
MTREFQQLQSYDIKIRQNNSPKKSEGNPTELGNILLNKRSEITAT